MSSESSEERNKSSVDGDKASSQNSGSSSSSNLGDDSSSNSDSGSPTNTSSSDNSNADTSKAYKREQASPIMDDDNKKKAKKTENKPRGLFDYEGDSLPERIDKPEDPLLKEGKSWGLAQYIPDPSKITLARKNCPQPAIESTQKNASSSQNITEPLLSIPQQTGASTSTNNTSSSSNNGKEESTSAVSQHNRKTTKGEQLSPTIDDDNKPKLEEEKDKAVGILSDEVERIETPKDPQKLQESLRLEQDLPESSEAAEKDSSQTSSEGNEKNKSSSQDVIKAPLQNESQAGTSGPGGACDDSDKTILVDAKATSSVSSEGNATTDSAIGSASTPGSADAVKHCM